MNPLELYQLKRFCDVHGLDYQLIDDRLSYSENMTLLSAFVPTDIEDLAEEYGRSYRDYEKAVSLSDLYGVREEDKVKAETPLLFHRAYVWFGYRNLRLVRNYMKPYDKNVEIYGKSWLIIKGQMVTITKIYAVLKDRVKCKLLTMNMEYQHEWSFLPTHGWVKNLTAHQ